jgi:hypothetical protein
MKITKVPGFGDYGILVENFDYNDPDHYFRLKEASLNNLVTILDGSGQDRFDQLNQHINTVFNPRPYTARWAAMYGWDWETRVSLEEIEVFNTTKEWVVNSNYVGWTKVSGQRDNYGKPMGVFGETELLWHNDDGANINFHPLINLYTAAHANTSATCFSQTATWYEQQSESFKSELNELVCKYTWDNSKIQPDSDQLNENIVRSNHMPPNYVDIPLVVTTPGGITGIYFNPMVTGFAGMSGAESDRLLKTITDGIYKPEYQYDHWYRNSKGDLVILDQCITLHSRKIDSSKNLKEELLQRVLYRCPSDYTGLENFNPFGKTTSNVARAERIKFRDYGSTRQYLTQLKTGSAAEKKEFLDKYVPKSDHKRFFELIQRLQ